MLLDEPGRRQDLNADRADGANHRMIEPQLKFVTPAATRGQALRIARYLLRT
jgi:hypothetical protein